MERYTARLKADYQAKKWLKVGANDTYIESEFEILQEQYVEESRAVEGIAFRTVGVQAGIRQTVRIRQQGTGQTIPYA